MNKIRVRIYQNSEMTGYSEAVLSNRVIESALDRFRLRWMFGKTFFQNRTFIEGLINLAIAVIAVCIGYFLGRKS